MDNVIGINGITYLKLDAKKMITAIAEELNDDSEIIVIVKNGSEITYHASNPEVDDTIYQIELMKFRLLSGEFV